MRQRSNESGQTLLIFTFALPVMLAAMGLVVDLGWSYYTQQAARSAAESGALAAAYYAYNNSGGTYTCGSNGVVCQSATQCPATLPNAASNDYQVACSYAKDNGFAVGSGGTQNVMVAAGMGTPPTVTGITVPYWVTVTVSQSLPQTFSAILGNKFSTVSVRATATYTSGTGSCVYVLNPALSGALSMTGTSNVLSGCSIFVDSSSSSALTMVGNSQITTTSGATTNIDGSYSAGGGATISPLPNTGAGTVADPLASMPPPTVGSCTSPGINIKDSTDHTLNPGVYCGAVSITGSGAITMNPGMYVFTNGFSTAGSMTLTGKGVTLYASGGGISISGSGIWNLSATESGPYQGILIYQDRGNTTGSTVVGTTGSSIGGVLYFPAASLTFTGTSDVNQPNYTLIADTIRFVGTTFMNHGASSPYTPGGGGASLIE
jgi:Flp pilus assembly protein TadG